MKKRVDMNKEVQDHIEMLRFGLSLENFTIPEKHYELFSILFRRIYKRGYKVKS